MGAKTWMLVGSSGSARDALMNGAELDREATLRLARRLFPGERFNRLDDVDLSSTCPPEDEVHIGCFPGVSIVAATEFGVDYPSRLDPRFLKELGMSTTHLHAMHSVVDWFAFTVWKGDHLVRSLSLSPDYGIMEDLGSRLPFEIPYWSGEFPAVAVDDEQDGDPPYPFPFHPLDLGEAALKEFFGYQLEGYVDESLLDPESVILMRLERKKSRFRFW